MLDILLQNIINIETKGLFTYGVVLVDNDKDQSAMPIFLKYKNIGLNICYYVEPIQNIELARNMAVLNAIGDYIAFIDDDEYPSKDWLIILYMFLKKTNADGVLGPVLPYFEVSPPDWIVKGKIFERENLCSGTILTWNQTRTGNALINLNLFKVIKFDPKYGSGGEDRDLFKRMIINKYIFIWCDNSYVYEFVSKERMKVSVMLKRACLRGIMAANAKNGINVVSDMIMSIIAVITYLIISPLLIIRGKHYFVKTLIKICDHAGKVFAYLGIRLIKSKYVVG